MKTLAFGSAVLVATFAGQAFAADLAAPQRSIEPSPPVYNKEPPIQPSSDWTGWYVGGNLGYGWGRPTWGTSSQATISWNDPGGLVGFAPFAAAGGFQFPDLRPSGVVGGVQLGYDWQTGRWVWGGVADFQASGMKASGTTFVAPTAGIAATSQSLSAQDNWLGTVRARLGYLSTPSVLLYASGGLAYGKVTNTLNFGFPVPAATSFIASQTATNLGWAAGIGVEYKVGPHLSVGLDALHFDLGTITVTAPETATATGLPIGAAGASLSATRRSAGDILRGVINYRL